MIHGKMKTDVFIIEEKCCRDKLLKSKNKNDADKLKIKQSDRYFEKVYSKF